MRYLIISFCVLLLAVPFGSASAQNIFDYQEYYIGTGYNVSYAPLGKINHILDRYNNNVTQEKEFADLILPNGFAVELGTHQSVFSFYGGFTAKRQTKKTKFVLNETLYQRNADLSMNAYYVGIGIFSPAGDRMGIGFSVAGEYTHIRLRSKEGVEGQLKNATYVSPVLDRLFGITGEFKLYAGIVDQEGTKLMIKPYYTYIPKRLDLTPFDELINPDLPADGTDLRQDFSHFGVRIIITYSVTR